MLNKKFGKSAVDQVGIVTIIMKANTDRLTINKIQDACNDSCQGWSKINKIIEPSTERLNLSFTLKEIAEFDRDRSHLKASLNYI